MSKVLHIFLLLSLHANITLRTQCTTLEEMGTKTVFMKELLQKGMSHFCPRKSGCSITLLFGHLVWTSLTKS